MRALKGMRADGGCVSGNLHQAEKENTPYARRMRREKQEQKDVESLIEFGRTRSETNKHFGAHGFEANPGADLRSGPSQFP